MKRAKLLISSISLVLAILLLGGIIGLVAALNATYNISGTVSYVAQHVNASVTYTKFACTEISEQPRENIEYATFIQQGLPFITVFNQETEGSEQVPDAQDFSFSESIVAYKMVFEVKNYGDFAISAKLTVETNPVLNELQHNWYVHIVGEDNTLNIDPQQNQEPGSAIIEVYFAITNLASDVQQTSINISINITKAAKVQVKFDLPGIAAITANIGKTITLPSVYNNQYQEILINNSMAVGAWKYKNTNIIFNEITKLTQNIILEPVWYSYSDSTENWENNGGFLSPINITEANVVVPKVVNGQPVTSIGEFAFQNNTTLKNIVLPEGLYNIEQQAFKNCTQLESIYIPSTLEMISDGYDILSYSIFSGCNSLSTLMVSPNNQTFKTVTGREIIRCNTEALVEFAPDGDTHYSVPEGVTRFEEAAITSFNNVQSINFPKSFNEVPLTVGGMFGETWQSFPSVQNITIHPQNPNFATDGKSFFSADYKILHLFVAHAGITHYTIPEGVQTVQYFAFAFVELQSVTMPLSMIFVGDLSFFGCEHLEQITFLGTPLVGILAFLNTNLQTVIINSAPAPEWRASFFDLYGAYPEVVAVECLELYQFVNLYLGVESLEFWNVISSPNPGGLEIEGQWLQIGMYVDMEEVLGLDMLTQDMSEVDFYFLNASSLAEYSNTSYWQHLSQNMHLIGG